VCVLCEAFYAGSWSSLLQDGTAGPSPVDSSRAWFAELFEGYLPQRFADDSVLKAPAAMEFLAEIRKLFDLLMALSQYPTSPEYEFERTSAALQLLAYLRKSSRTDMYIMFVHQLCNLHKTLSNYVEAGHTLLLHANTIEWEAASLEAFSCEHGTWPKQSGAERRLGLLEQAIELFDRGEAWEEALILCDAVCARMRVECNYVQLATTLRSMADFYDKILATERFQPTYFLVGYYGRKFPEDYRNRCVGGGGCLDRGHSLANSAPCMHIQRVHPSR
jgi:dedicator of cytokinesis protein 1